MHNYNEDKVETAIVLTGSELAKRLKDARNVGINDAWELAKKWVKLNKSLNMSAKDAFLEAEREDARDVGINDAWELLAALTELKDQLSELETKANKLKGRLENYVSARG